MRYTCESDFLLIKFTAHHLQARSPIENVPWGEICCFCCPKKNAPSWFEFLWIKNKFCPFQQIITLISPLSVQFRRLSDTEFHLTPNKRLFWIHINHIYSQTLIFLSFAGFFCIIQLASGRFFARFVDKYNVFKPYLEAAGLSKIEIPIMCFWKAD